MPDSGVAALHVLELRTPLHTRRRYGRERAPDVPEVDIGLNITFTMQSETEVSRFVEFNLRLGTWT